MIGLFDSGLGGLTVLRRVREVLPQHDLLFFADQAHMPYGDRSADELMQLLARNLAWLDDEGVDAVVMACNTSCAAAAQNGWPPNRAPVLDLIESAAIAVERSGRTRIGVIATTATTRTRAYSRGILRRVPEASVMEVAAPELVPLVEAGILRGPQAREAVARALLPIVGEVDALVLGCTHYPLLDDHFAGLLGEKVALIDPAVVHAERARDLVEQGALKAGSGRLECVTSGDPARFEENLQRLAGDLSAHVIRVTSHS